VKDVSYLLLRTFVFPILIAAIDKKCCVFFAVQTESFNVI
jgi:hypothetical protein